MDQQSIVRQATDCMYTDVGGEAVILGAKSYVALDGIGKVIWQRIAEPVAVGDLCGALASAYDGPVAEIEADAAAFLSQLHAEGLVEIISRKDGAARGD
jgi:hypothetical protein